MQVVREIGHHHEVPNFKNSPLFLLTVYLSRRELSKVLLQRKRMVMVLFLLQEAEAEYQRKLKEALERPAIDRVHPMRIMGSALRAKSN